MLDGLKGPEGIILILLVALLFGAKRLPDAARGLGRSLRIFKAETRGLMTDDEAAEANKTTVQQVTPPPVLPQPAPVQPVVAPVPPVVQAPVQPVQPVQVQPVQQAPEAAEH